MSSLLKKIRNYALVFIFAALLVSSIGLGIALSETGKEARKQSAALIVNMQRLTDSIKQMLPPVGQPQLEKERRPARQ